MNTDPINNPPFNITILNNYIILEFELEVKRKTEDIYSCIFLFLSLFFHWTLTLSFSHPCFLCLSQLSWSMTHMCRIFLYGIRIPQWPHASIMRKWKSCTRPWRTLFYTLAAASILTQMRNNCSNKQRPLATSTQKSIPPSLQPPTFANPWDSPLHNPATFTREAHYSMAWSVQCVLPTLCIISQHVQHKCCGMANKQPAKEEKKTNSSMQQERGSASIFNVLWATPPQLTSINALAVESLVTEHQHAVLLRKTRVLTSLWAEAWDLLLCRADLLEEYLLIVPGIVLGFHISIPCITSTIALPNSPSLYIHHDHFTASVQHKFNASHYIGPFLRCKIELLIGPFQTFLLSIIPKPHKPNAFCLIQNFSFLHHSSSLHTSINSHINSDNYLCTWEPSILSAS